MAKKKTKGPSKAQLRALSQVLLGAATLEEQSPELERLGIPPGELGIEDVTALRALVTDLQKEGPLNDPQGEVGVDLGDLSPLLGLAWVESLVALQAVPHLVTLAERGPNKGLRRGAKAGLRRLDQQGVKIPTLTAGGGSYRSASYTLRGAMSGVDHLGRQMVSMLIQEPGEETQLCAFLFNEELGIEDATLQATTPGSFDRDFLRRPPGSTVRMVEVPPSHALYVFDRGMEISRQERRSVPVDVIQALLKAKAAFPPGAAAVPGAEAVKPLTGPQSKPAYEQLIGEPEILGWQPPKPAIEAGMTKLAEAVQSKVVVSEDLKRERMEGALLKGAIGYFTPKERSRWAYRLNAAALIFAATKRPEAATTALGFAKSVADTTILVQDVPFLSDLFAGHVIMALQEMFGPGGGPQGLAPDQGPEASGDDSPLIIPG